VGVELFTTINAMTDGVVLAGSEEESGRAVEVVGIKAGS
jgi:hypothetical protein